MLDTFRQIYVGDFEFRHDDGEPLPQTVWCLVLKELRSGKVSRFYPGDLERLEGAVPFPTGGDVLYVGFFTPAEWSCHLRLGWAIPENSIDLYSEFRWLTSGLPPRWNNGQRKGAYSLTRACAFHGLVHASADTKDFMREIAIKGDPTPEQLERLVDYCQDDVEATARLFLAMADKIDGPRALLRGAYCVAVAHMEAAGIPVDLDLYHSLRDRWEEIKLALVRERGAPYGVFEGLKLRDKLLEEYIDSRGMNWPRTPTGRPSTDKDTFKSMAGAYPEIEDLYFLVSTLRQLKVFDLPVGSDGRTRASIMPCSASSGRNAPSTTKFLFCLPAYLRRLAKPPPGRVLVYLDYCAEEYAIAAALSQDPEMLRGYLGGDPHLDFAKKAGLVPEDATKESHAREREAAKACNFGILYGMGARALGFRTGKTQAAAAALLQAHKQSYPRFWQWAEGSVAMANLRRAIYSRLGWRRLVTPDTRATALQNFPVQAGGGDCLRAACISLVKAEIQVSVPVHDAVLVETSEGDVDFEVAKARQIMGDVSEALFGIRIRTDTKLVRWPDRYIDGRGEAIWETVERCLASVYESAAVRI